MFHVYVKSGLPDLVLTFTLDKNVWLIVTISLLMVKGAFFPAHPYCMHIAHTEKP